MLFTGIYEHIIDAKQRLAIPSEVRDQIHPDRDGNALYVSIGEGPILCLYTERGFEQRANELDHSELPPQDVLEYEQMFFPLARRVELDKQGRVRLPDQLLKIINPGKEIVLTGMKDHMEIHPRDKWQQHIRNMLDTRPELLRNPRRVMRTQTDAPNKHDIK